MMPIINPGMPNINGNLENLKYMLANLPIKSLNQSEKMHILELLENLIQNYNLVELDYVIDKLLENLEVNDVFSIKIIYYKAKKELLSLNIVEANKFINLGLNKIKNMVEKDKNLVNMNELLTIEKYKCNYLSGDYKESLVYFSTFEKKIDVDQVINLEVSLNIGLIKLLTGDIESCINIYKDNFNLVKQMGKNFLQVKITHMLGDYYQRLGDFENSKNYYKVS